MNQQTYFKVVSLTNSGRRISYNIRGSTRENFSVPTPYVLEYREAIKTKPLLRGSKLFAFDSLEHAKRLRGANEEIWECALTNPQRIKYYDEMGFEENIENFWRARRSKKSTQAFGNGHTGTVCGDSITLLRRVKVD